MVYYTHLYCISFYFRVLLFFFFKQKTAYEMHISDWSSDVCSSDLQSLDRIRHAGLGALFGVAQELLQKQRIASRPLDAPQGHQIGRASCRERVCQYV